MRPRLAVLLAIAPLALAACKTPQERLVDRRHALRAVLDREYAAYGGTATAQPSSGEPQPQDPGILGRMVGEVDRSYFERQCLTVGRGERPLAVTARLDAFLRDPVHVRECRRAAELQDEVDALERKVGGG